MNIHRSLIAVSILLLVAVSGCAGSTPTLTRQINTLVPATLTLLPASATPDPITPTSTDLPAAGTQAPTRTSTATDTPAQTATAELPDREQVIANLVAFARLYGYIRYFHPSDQAAELNWERAAINGVEQVKYAADSSELVQRLGAFFEPAAPAMRVFPVGEQPALPADLAAPADGAQPRVVMWQHYGVAGEYPDGIYQSEIISAILKNGSLPEGFYDPREPFYADLGGGTAALVPVALFADDEGTLPRPDSAGQPSPDEGLAPGVLNRRLAGVVIAWNVFQHFYPYFDVVDTDWAGVLKESLAGALEASNEREYYDVLRSISARLADGHAYVTNPDQSSIYKPYLQLAWVEDSIVVLDARQAAGKHVSPGDVILAIDDRSAVEALGELEALTSAATPQWKHIRALPELLNGPLYSEVKLDLLTPTGEQKTVRLVREIEYWAVPPHPPRPGPVAEVEPGIMYVDLDRVEYEQYETAIPLLESARGMVLDLRGYPRDSRVVLDVISHLTDNPVKIVEIQVPITTYPDQQDPRYDHQSENIEPQAPRWRGKVVFLTDGTALSAAETFMGIIEHYRLAEIVGQPTGGTNGAADYFSIPGGYTLRWTPMKVLKHDGSPLHGVGIQPTVLVSPTIRGIAEGRDEQLERAIALINQ